MNNWRLYLIITLLILSFLDIILTHQYVYIYKKWQENKPYAMIEKNPLIVFFWNTFGLHLGTFIVAIIILSLVYIIGRYAHPVVGLLLIGALLFAMYNHFTNIPLLNQLIEKYPSGYLDPKVFGEVIGNNPAYLNSEKGGGSW